MATSDTKMTTDMELAEEIERRRLKHPGRPDEWLNSNEYLGMILRNNADQIIAALRRAPDAIYKPLLYACEHALLSTAASRAVNDQLLRDIRSALALAEPATTGGGQLIPKTGLQEPPADERLTVAAGPERPPSGEMVMVPREPTRILLLDMATAFEGFNTHKELIDYLGYSSEIVVERARKAYRAVLAEAEGKLSDEDRIAGEHAYNPSLWRKP